MYGIPFEGIDAYQNGAGSMKGVIAKTFTLFDQKGEAMDQAGLPACLAESLLLLPLLCKTILAGKRLTKLTLRQ